MSEPVPPADEPDIVETRLPRGYGSDILRLGVTLANGALAATRSSDVPPKFRLAHRLGVAVLTGATLFAQELPAYTGRPREVGARTMAGLSLAAAAATFAGYGLIERTDRATDAWLARLGVRNPQALAGLAGVAFSGAATLAQDHLSAPGPSATFTVVPLPEKIRAALTVVLSGLEDRDPASAAALHQQLDAALMVLADGVEVGEEDLRYVALDVSAEKVLRAVPHDQTVPARGHFSRGGRDLDIVIQVFGGQLAVVGLEDPEGDDEEPLTLEHWPEPGDIRVVFDEPAEP